MPILTTPHQVHPTLRASPAWQPFKRIEDTGANPQTVIDAVSNLSPGKLLLAEGDSWFDKFTPIGAGGTNLLSAIRTPFDAAVVDLSHIGDLAEDMVSGWQARRTKRLFDLFDFDAILLSAGGNDLIAMFQQFYSAKATGKVLPGAPFTAQHVAAFGMKPGQMQPFFDQLIAHLKAFIALRDDAARPRTRQAPLLLHAYDYMQPRPAPAQLFGLPVLSAGPWMYPVMHQAALSDLQMRQAGAAVIDTLFDRIETEIAQVYDNVFLVDQRGTLALPPPGSTGEVGDWMDEIHPSAQGFDKLAAHCWEVPLNQLLGWRPGAGDLVP